MLLDFISWYRIINPFKTVLFISALRMSVKVSTLLYKNYTFHSFRSVMYIYSCLPVIKEHRKNGSSFLHMLHGKHTFDSSRLFLEDWCEGNFWPTHCIIPLQFLMLSVEILLKCLSWNLVNRCQESISS